MKAVRRFQPTVEPARWPVALALASAGHPIGCWPCKRPDGDTAVLVVDLAGELLELRRLPAAFAVRWCVNRHLRIHQSLGHLVDEMHAGRVLGWVPGLVVEHKRGRMARVVAVPVDLTLPGETAIAGVLCLVPADL